MSQEKNSFVPRKGQQAVFEYCKTNPQEKILPVRFPGGYGKTAAIALAYQAKRDITRQCDRLLVVVANDIQLFQIQNEFAAECRRIGFTLQGGVYPCDSDHNPEGVSKKNLVEAFVTTIQRVSSTNRSHIDPLRRLLCDGHQWMLAADEYHHYGVANDWGIALQRLVDLASFTIATSATPDRDREPTIFGKTKLEVKYIDAIEEQAVKSLRVRHWNYRVRTENTHTGDIVEFTTEQLREEIGTDDVDTALQRRHLRLHPKYISPVLTGAIGDLINDRSELHPDCQLLVRAFSCNHAKLLCDQIRAYSCGLDVDWVGTKTEYAGRPDDENHEVIRRFCPPKDENGIRPRPTLPILVQVNMCGEGFDSIYVSQLVDLSLVNLKGNAN